MPLGTDPRELVLTLSGGMVYADATTVWPLLVKSVLEERGLS